jgi:hypothetical protein
MDGGGAGCCGNGEPAVVAEAVGTELLILLLLLLLEVLVDERQKQETRSLLVVAFCSITIESVCACVIVPMFQHKNAPRHRSKFTVMDGTL